MCTQQSETDYWLEAILCMQCNNKNNEILKIFALWKSLNFPLTTDNKIKLSCWWKLNYLPVKIDKISFFMCIAMTSIECNNAMQSVVTVHLYIYKKKLSDNLTNFPPLHLQFIYIFIFCMKSWWWGRKCVTFMTRFINDMKDKKEKNEYDPSIKFFVMGVSNENYTFDMWPSSKDGSYHFLTHQTIGRSSCGFQINIP